MKCFFRPMILIIAIGLLFGLSGCSSDDSFGNASRLLSSSTDSLKLKVTTLNADPSPFEGSTVISFDIPIETTVFLEVQSVTGYQVRLLIDNEVRPAGHWEIEWDGKNNDGEVIENGVYLIHVTAGSLEDWETAVYCETADCDGLSFDKPSTVDREATR